MLLQRPPPIAHQMPAPDCLTPARNSLLRSMMADDMGWGDWSRTGSPASTPHLEAMSRADSGAWFRRAYSGNPICSPTRASVLTGRTPSRTCIYGVEQHILCRETPGVDGGCLHGEYSIANATRDHAAGFISGFYGKWHLVGGFTALSS